MRKRSISILALVIALIITTYFTLLIWGTTGVSGGPVSTDIFDNPSDTNFGGLFAHPDIDDSLPHYLYQHLADSFKQIQDERELENRSTRLSGTSFGSLGVYAMDTPEKKNSDLDNWKSASNQLNILQEETNKKIATLSNKDSIKLLNDQMQDTLAYFNRITNHTAEINDTAQGKLYYLGVTGYSLVYEKKFFVQNGTYNLAIPKLDSLKKADNGDSWRYIHYERKQIPVRYSTENKRLLIPVSQQQYEVLNIIIPVFSFSLIFVALYFFLGLPIQILINISKGKAFDDRNFKRFFLMAQVLLYWGIIQILSAYILRFLFRKMIPDDFTLPGFWSTLYDNCGLFILVLAIFITGKAFQKGNRLQKEQDLTI